VADPTPGDRPVESTNGPIEGQQETVAPASGPPDDDQTLADRDQTLAEADQTASDSDQTAADSDQAAADSDQAASDRDLVHGGDAGVHDLTRDLRDRSAERRRQAAHARVEAAAARDAVAHARDLAAEARDQAAALHDRELAARDASWTDDGHAVTGAEIVLRASANRKRAAADRAAAAQGRARAAADRAQAQRDREQAARDRAQAQADREALLHQLAIAETDALTGTRTRAPGLADLEREIDRARRTTGPLAVAYVDVVGLKAVNDTQGHSAGDTLLQRAVRAIRGHLRSYDSIVRIGGDEFLCVMSGATIPDARRRFGAVQAALAADPDWCEIKVGFAALEPEDSAAELIQRADADLPAGRRQV
jgi:diguanylate cyclase (GGDEF)-like protein